jgi:thioesterase domain-containing protein
MGTLQRFFRSYRFLPAGESLGYGEVRRFMRLLSAHLRAGRAYAPAPLPCRLTLFQTTERLTEAEADAAVHAAGWRALAPGGLEVHQVPGHHLSLLARPAVETLAAKLGARLAALTT